jgi:uncharacterized protein (TIGR02147 family)
MTVYNFTDIRSLLKTFISELPRKGRGEGTKIARRLGVSTTLVSQVLAGDKHFTPEQTRILCEHLGLSGGEADYLMFLGQMDRAGTQELRRYWKSKLEELRKRGQKVSNRVKAKRVLDDRERAVFYSNPLYSAIRLFTSVGTEGKSLAEICERFEISHGKAAEIVNFLVECGLCVEKRDRFSMGAQSTHLEQGSPHLLKHHSNWRIRALRQSEDLLESELMYTAPVSLSRADFAALREEMVEFIKKVLAKVHASPAEEIACFNLDFFWIRK